MRRGGVVVAALLLASSCGFKPNGAAPGGDGPTAVDAPRAIDAGSGSGSGSGSANAAQDLVLGAGRITVGGASGITVDVQLGAGPQPTHLTAGALTIDGQPVVKP